MDGSRSEAPRRLPGNDRSAQGCPVGSRRSVPQSRLFSLAALKANMPTPQASPEYPSISVVIPTYNRAEKVRRAIESVLAQTVRNLEIIVVDDGSSDETALVLERAFGNRIGYFAQPNQGAGVAGNPGIEEATGEWIAFLDSDDLWEPEKIEQQLDALRHVGTNCGACYTDVRFFNH